MPARLWMTATLPRTSATDRLPEDWKYSARDANFAIIACRVEVIANLIPSTSRSRRSQLAAALVRSQASSRGSGGALGRIATAEAAFSIASAPPAADIRRVYHDGGERYSAETPSSASLADADLTVVG